VPRTIHETNIVRTGICDAHFCVFATCCMLLRAADVELFYINLYVYICVLDLGCAKLAITGAKKLYLERPGQP
jgi:hypothetical protein